MSEQTNGAVSLTVNRNEVALPFKQVEKTRGSAEADPKEPYALLKGSKYLTPDVENVDILQLAKWVGEKVFRKKIGAWLNQWSQGIYEESVAQGEGTFNEATFITLAEQFSARGESMKELQEQQQDLVLQLSEISDEELDTQAGMQKMKDIRDELKAIKVAIASKKRLTKEEKEAAKTAVA